MSSLNVGRLNATGTGVKFPSYATNNLPTGEVGLTVWDTTDSKLKIYNGADWVPVPGQEDHPVGSQAFAYTGSDQAWVVPANVTKIKIKVWGGGGGGGGTSGWSDGGRGGGGGHASGNYDVTPGQAFTVVVGQNGTQRSPTRTYGGGGRAANTWGPGSGAGLSGVFTGGSSVFSGASPQAGAFPRSLILAGGGGGGGATRNPNSTNGGGGGGSSGASGTANYNNNNGTGGSQGLAGTSRCTANAGQLSGGDSQNPYGAGGGSGYYGGGGGCYQEPLDMGGGGGGSGYIAGSITGAILVTGGTGSNSPGGPANSSDIDNQGAGTGGNTNSPGTPGRVVISWPY